MPGGLGAGVGVVDLHLPLGAVGLDPPAELVAADCQHHCEGDTGHDERRDGLLVHFSCLFRVQLIFGDLPRVSYKLRPGKTRQAVSRVAC